MTRYDSDGDDCAAALSAAVRVDYGPPVTLTGLEAHTLLQTLRDASDTLQRAETSKIWNVRSAAQETRKRVIAAWATLDAKRAAAAKAANTPENTQVAP